MRLWSMPTSLLTKVAVSVVPALTRMTVRSNARFMAVTVIEVTAGTGGAVVGAGAVVAGGVVAAGTVLAGEGWGEGAA